MELNGCPADRSGRQGIRVVVQGFMKVSRHATAVAGGVRLLEAPPPSPLRAIVDAAIGARRKARQFLKAAREVALIRKSGG